MSLRHKDYREFGREQGALLREFISRQREREFSEALNDAFWFYAFVFEDFAEKATKNRALFSNIGVMLVEVHDLFRGVVEGQEALSPVILGSLSRIALEVRCNLKLILTRDDPAVLADRYMRFGRVSTLAHDLKMPEEKRRLSEQVVNDTVRDCAEWIAKRPDGTLKINLNWTAEGRFDSLKKIAAEIGFVSDYETTYSATSQFVHGTYLLVNAYRGPTGIWPVGEVPRCKQLAFIGSSHCMHILNESASFFGVPLDQDAFMTLRGRLMDSCRELLPGGKPI